MKVKAVISAALLCAFAISASGCDGADIGTDNLILRKLSVTRRKSNSLLPTPLAADTP